MLADTLSVAASSQLGISHKANPDKKLKLLSADFLWPTQKPESTLRAGTENPLNERLLLPWVNSLNLPSCLLVSRFDDLRDGNVFLDIAHKVCGKADISFQRLLVPHDDFDSPIDRIGHVLNLLGHRFGNMPRRLESKDAPIHIVEGDRSYLIEMVAYCRFCAGEGPAVDVDSKENVIMSILDESVSKAMQEKSQGHVESPSYKRRKEGAVTRGRSPRREAYDNPKRVSRLLSARRVAGKKRPDANDALRDLGKTAAPVRAAPGTIPQPRRNSYRNPSPVGHRPAVGPSDFKVSPRAGVAVTEAGSSSAIGATLSTASIGSNGGGKGAKADKDKGPVDYRDHDLCIYYPSPFAAVSMTPEPRPLAAQVHRNACPMPPIRRLFSVSGKPFEKRHRWGYCMPLTQRSSNTAKLIARVKKEQPPGRTKSQGTACAEAATENVTVAASDAPKSARESVAKESTKNGKEAGSRPRSAPPSSVGKQEAEDDKVSRRSSPVSAVNRTPSRAASVVSGSYQPPRLSLAGRRESMQSRQSLGRLHSVDENRTNDGTSVFSGYRSVSADRRRSSAWTSVASAVRLSNMSRRSGSIRRDAFKLRGPALTELQTEILSWLELLGLPVLQAVALPPDEPLTPTDISRVFRDGVLLCKLVGILERSKIENIVDRPKKAGQALHNVNKALEKLRGRHKKMKDRYLWAGDDIVAGDTDTVWGILEDIRMGYSKFKRASVVEGESPFLASTHGTPRSMSLPPNVRLQRNAPGTPSALAVPSPHVLKNLSLVVESALSGVNPQSPKRPEKLEPLPSITPQDICIAREWLESLYFNILDSDLGHHEPLVNPFRNGTLLCRLVEILENRDVTFCLEPITIEDARNNLQTALEFLRRHHRFPGSLLWREEEMLKGDKNAIWGLLCCLKQAYPDATVSDVNEVIGGSTPTDYTATKLRMVEDAVIDFLSCYKIVPPDPTGAKHSLNSLRTQIQDGTLLCDLVGHVSGKKLTGVFQNPRTKRIRLKNISRALENLRANPNMSTRFLFSEEKILDWDRVCILGIFEDIIRCHDGVPKRTSQTSTTEPYLGKHFDQPQDPKLKLAVEKRKEKENSRMPPDTSQIRKLSTMIREQVGESGGTTVLNIINKRRKSVESLAAAEGGPGSKAVLGDINASARKNSTLDSNFGKHFKSTVRSLESEQRRKSSNSLAEPQSPAVSAVGGEPSTPRGSVRKLSYASPLGAARSTGPSDHADDDRAKDMEPIKELSRECVGDDDMTTLERNIAATSPKISAKLATSLEKWVREGLRIKLAENSFTAPILYADFYDGTLLCKIVAAVEVRDVPGMTRKPKSRASYLHNIEKALTVLRQRKNMPITHLWSNRDIHNGDPGVILPLLHQIRVAYAHAKGKPTSRAKKLNLEITKPADS